MWSAGRFALVSSHETDRHRDEIAGWSMHRVAAGGGLEMIKAGCVWWEARSANAAMVALAKSGVKFRTIINEDGTVERWKRPRLADWEKLRRDPREVRPLHPEVAVQRRGARLLHAALHRLMMHPQSATHSEERWVFPICQQNLRPLDPARRFRSRPRYRNQSRQILSSNAGRMGAFRWPLSQA
jgi:hypothetical protein